MKSTWTYESIVTVFFFIFAVYILDSEYRLYLRYKLKRNKKDREREHKKQQHTNGNDDNNS